MPEQQYIFCFLYKGAFSGEVNFSFTTFDGSNYEGIAPKHYANPQHGLSKTTPTFGNLNIHVVKKDDEKIYIRLPDGETVAVTTGILSSLRTY